MERLTDKDLTKACNDPWDYCGLDAVCARNCHKPTPCKLPKMIYRLAEIEDILGDDYDLDRLRELAQADREGRCVVLRSEDTNVLTRADRIRTMSDEELTGQFGAQSNEPLTCTGCVYRKREGWNYEQCVRCKRHWGDRYRRPPEGEEEKT